MDPGDGDARAAADEVVLELVASEPAVDLREQVPPSLRAPHDDPTAGGTPPTSPGCPCGCGDAELLLRARGGDERAMEALLKRYRALARHKARSYFLVGADAQDVLQEVMIGVYKAIRDYEPTRGASFRTFADMCVSRQLVDAVRGATRLKHAALSTAVPIDLLSDPNDETPAARGHLLAAPPSADPAAAVVSAEELRALRRHLDEVLSDLEQQVLRHHVEGKSYDEIAGMLQRHVKSVDNALQRIKRKLQPHLDARAAG